MDVVTIDDFKRIDLRVAEIKAAERVEGTDKLMKLTIDVGEETRTLVAGIAERYQAADLVGRRIIVLANLQPRKLRGVESKGMLLAASWGNGELAIVSVDGAAPPGARVS